MHITSTAFKPNSSIPQKYSCEGQGINPSLIISDVPGEAKSLALIVDDPDAPGGTFTHWVVWNILPTTSEIQEGSVPEGARQGKNSSGKNSFVAPCPPSGTHRYIFALFALNKILSNPEGDKKEDIMEAMTGSILEKAELSGTYQKQS